MMMMTMYSDLLGPLEDHQTTCTQNSSKQVNTGNKYSTAAQHVDVNDENDNDNSNLGKV